MFLSAKPLYSKLMTLDRYKDPINYAPLARPDVIPVLQATTEGPWLSFGPVLANDTDTEQNTLIAELVQPPAQGTVTLQEDGTFSFVPTATAWSSATFMYRASDGIGELAVVTATFFAATNLHFLPLLRNGN